MDGIGVSSPGDFNDSPFSDLVDDRVSFLLGAFNEFLKSRKRKKEFLERERQDQKFWIGVCKGTVHRGLKGQNKYSGFDTIKL